MLIGFTVITVGSFLVSGLKLANRLPRHTPFRDRLIETSEAYHVFARANESLLSAFLLSFPVLFSFYRSVYFAAQAVDAMVSFRHMITIMPLATSIISLPITPRRVCV